MNFQRFRLDTIDSVALRAVGAREGWILESAETLRVGFGAVVASFSLSDGLDGSLSAIHELSTVSVSGPPAPSGTGPVAFVTVPFSRSEEVRCWLPEHQITRTSDGGWWLTTTALSPEAALDVLERVPAADVRTSTVIDRTYQPTPDGYARAVASAVDEMRHSDIEKVVLARRVAGQTERPIDPAAVAERLHEREPACTLYGVPSLRGGRFIGASPELLVSCIDGAVSCHPLAGTVALPEGEDSVDYAKWLMGSAKNLFEHRVMVDDIVDRLSQSCEDVRADARPSIVALRSVAHLGTWIQGKVTAEPSPSTTLELLRLLHPTAAVGGIPADRARDVISRLEPEPRGLYAGAVGWLDIEGNGEFWVAIRGLVLNGDHFSAWAGAGIVAESDPIAEREETRDKLASILVGLGASALSS